MNRVVVYVDGFNLYYGLKSRKWRRYYWLDLRRLAERLLRPGQQLETVHYFTTRVADEPHNPGKATRQNSYLEALETLENLETHTGISCRRNGVAINAERQSEPTKRR